MIELNNEYRKTFRACSYDEDAFRRLSPAAALRFAQQIAIDQCAEKGMNAEFYKASHTAFLMARQTIVFDKELPAKTSYTYVTHPCGMKRASYRRYTEIFDEQGERAARLDSIWMLVDTESKKILRREPEEYSIVQWPPEVDFPALELKLQKAEELENCGERRADYSLCDENGHLNNTRYADLFLDVLPLEVLGRGQVRQMTLHYHREVPVGQSFVLHRGRVNDRLWYLYGEMDGHCCVEANILLAE